MLVELVLFGLAGCGGYLLAKGSPQPRPNLVLRGSTGGYSPQIRSASRAMQVALLQLQEAKDYRRAACFAQHASQVPLAFRQRQFNRFRSLIVSKFVALIESGTSADALMPGLIQLVKALGIAEFEADYIRQEAESQLSPTGPARRDFRQQLRQAEVNHRERLQAIKDMGGLDSEIHEQLIEQEKMRFQEQMRELSACEDTGNAP